MATVLVLDDGAVRPAGGSAPPTGLRPPRQTGGFRHPELTFGRLSGGAPLEKKKTPGGILKRVELLPISNHSGLSGDHLDACAMALTARAYHLGHAVAFSNDGGPLKQQQARGTTPAIWSI